MTLFQMLYSDSQNEFQIQACCRRMKGEEFHPKVLDWVRCRAALGRNDAINAPVESARALAQSKTLARHSRPDRSPASFGPEILACPIRVVPLNH
jgi:hypothetical protein